MQLIALYKVVFMLAPLLRYNSMTNELDTFTPKQNVPENMKDAFLTLDKDQNFMISVKDLDTVFTDLGQDYSKVELEVMINTIHRNRYRTVGYLDFIRYLVSTYRDTPNKLETKDAFNVFDKDDNGYFTVHEARHVVYKLCGRVPPDYIVTGFINSLDTDGDGQISFEEFSIKYSTLFKKVF
ncbi:hypothetical protein ACFFRR_004728 [Megaselia abdita]